MRNKVTNNRSGFIDIIRFIAALLIMAHHMYHIGLQYYPFWDCWIYTEFFLLITGYFTAKHFENYGGGNRSKDAILYTIKKICSDSAICMVSYIICVDNRNHFGNDVSRMDVGMDI